MTPAVLRGSRRRPDATAPSLPDKFFGTVATRLEPDFELKLDAAKVSRVVDAASGKIDEV